MKVTLLKNTRKKEVMNRLELLSVVEMIRNNPEAQKVFNLRLNYSFMKPERKEDGQIVIDGENTVSLPRICFAAEFDKYKEKARMQAYNGLVVVEVNGLKQYEDAVSIRNQAARMDETLLAFLGASGKSVKIVCRGELYKDASQGGEDIKLPEDEADIRQFSWSGRCI